MTLQKHLLAFVVGSAVIGAVLGALATAIHFLGPFGPLAILVLPCIYGLGRVIIE